jgi:hypothetical protein
MKILSYYKRKTEWIKPLNCSVSVILDVWKRNYLDEQLQAVIKQTISPAKIYILHCKNECNVESKNIIEKFKKDFPNIFVIKSDLNWKYFGRMNLATAVDTDFCWILDDDVIPSAKWIEKCLAICVKEDAIVSCTGRIIPQNDLWPEVIKHESYRKCFVGDQANDLYNYCENLTQVDYGCNSYFFSSELIRCFWNIWPITFQTGEDIHLAATCRILRNVPTYVLKQSFLEESGNVKRNYGRDEHASYKKAGFIQEREKVFRYLIGLGWNPLLW